MDHDGALVAEGRDSNDSPEVVKVSIIFCEFPQKSLFYDDSKRMIPFNPKVLRLLCHSPEPLLSPLRPLV